MKNSKRIKIIVVLMLLIFTGLVGYGVYSYYWTEGSFSGTESVSIATFNPQTYIAEGDFLGNGGVIRLDCSVVHNWQTNSDNICSGSLDITNEGDTDIVLSISDASSNSVFVQGVPGSPDYMGPANNMSVSTSTPTFSWESITIEPGESESLGVEVYASVNDGFDSSSAIEATESITDSYSSGYHDNYQVYVSFKVKAEQAH